MTNDVLLSCNPLRLAQDVRHVVIVEKQCRPSYLF